MKYTKQEIIDLTKDAALIETYVFTSDNHRIHTDNIRYIGTGTFDNQEIENLPFKKGEVDVKIHIMDKEDYETTVIANSCETWPEDLTDDDKIAVIIVNEEEEDEETRKLYALQVKVWDADDYLNDRNTDPLYTDLYLFATKEEAKSNALALHADDSVYNECFIFTGELTAEEILETTGFDSIEDFDEALEEPYSDDPNAKNYGETEKTDVAKAIIEDPESEEDAECANYDFDKSLEGSILVFWSWEKYVGYARKCIDIRRAEESDTAAMLTKRDKNFATQCDVLLTAEEVEATTDIQDLRETVTQALENSKWKWTNPAFANSLANRF